MFGWDMQPERVAGLDGLRGIAVALVVAFHFWPEQVPGGFLGVSVFFALSGFLITRQVLADSAFRVTAFYGRRFRRLMPLALVTLVLTALVWRGLGWLDAGTGRDVRWALGNAANWQRIVDGSQYGAGAVESPIDHFWSLSIEEQFYCVFPLLVLLGRTRRRLAVIASVLLVGVIVALLHANGDPSVVYFSSLIRCGEILAGVLAACAVHGRDFQRQQRRSSVWWDTASAAGLVALVGLSLFASLESSGLYRGGLLAVGAGSAGLIVCLRRSGLVAKCVDGRLLRWAGSRSYALYLFHWPLIVSLRRVMTSDLAPWCAAVLAVALAEAAKHAIEAPIARRSVSSPYVVVGCTLLAAGAIFSTSGMRSIGVDFAAAQRDLDATFGGLPTQVSVANSVPVPSAPITEPALAPRPITSTPARTYRIALVGDSKALVLALAQPYLRRSVMVSGFVNIGCPLGRTGRVRSVARGGEGRSLASFNCDWTGVLASRVVSNTPIDAVVVDFGTWDASERLVPALGSTWRTMNDSVYESWLTGEILALTTEVEAAGARRVIMLTAPLTRNPEWSRRIERFNELLKHLERITGRFQVVDLQRWLDAQADKDQLSPDASHFSYLPDGGTAREVYERFLEGAIINKIVFEPHITVAADLPPRVR